MVGKAGPSPIKMAARNVIEGRRFRKSGPIEISAGEQHAILKSMACRSAHKYA
jgi:hypothetical protein